MKLSKEDIKKYGTKKELQEMARFSSALKLIFLVFKDSQYVESFEDSFLGAFTDGKKAYRAAETWSRKLGRGFAPYTIYQVLLNMGLSGGMAEDVTDNLEDFYGEQEDETI